MTENVVSILKAREERKKKEGEARKEETAASGIALSFEEIMKANKAREERLRQERLKENSKLIKSLTRKGTSR